MVDHPTQRRRRRRIERIRRAMVDRRPLFLVALGLVAASVLVAAVWRLDRTAESESPRRRLDLDRIAVPTVPTEEELASPATDFDRDTIASLRQGASVQVADSTGRLAQEYGADRIDPLPDDWIEMARPWARFHPSNGRLVEMTADTGNLRVPERAIESGRLDGDVRIRIFDPVDESDGNERVASIEIDAEQARYDATSGRLESPGRVHVRTSDASFVGEDLRIDFTDDGETIRRLTVERAIGPIEISGESAVLASASPSGTAPTASPASTPAVEKNDEGGRRPRRSNDRPVDAAVAWQARGSAPEPVAPEATGVAVVPEEVYRLVLDRDVVIERVGAEGRSRVSGDRLEVVFPMRSGGLGDTLASSPPRPVPARPETIVASAAMGRVAVQAAPSESDVDVDRVLIHFTGRLVMTPAAEAAGLLSDADDAHVLVTGVEGAGITLEDEQQEASGTAARLEYRVATERIDLIGDERNPLSIRSPRFSLDGGLFWWNRDAATGGLVGPGRMTFDEAGAASVRTAWRIGERGWRLAASEGRLGDPVVLAIASAAWSSVADDPEDPEASPPQLEIVWEGGVDLEFGDTEDRSKLRQARFRGDVRVDGDEFRLGSQNLVVDFAEDGASDDIERILATGQARVDRVGETGYLEAAAIDLGLGRSEDGSTIPTEMIAQGDVAASDPTQTLWTERLVVRFRPVVPGSEDAPRSRGLAGGVAGVDDMGQVDIDTVDATDGVQVRLEEGARVFADRLRGDAEAGVLELQGEDVMIIRGNVVADGMREIRLDDGDRKVTSPGPGRFRYFEEAVVADEPTRIERPDPPVRSSLAATWREAMAYRQDEVGERGRLVLDGDVRVRSTPDDRTSDRLDARSVTLDLVHGAGGVRGPQDSLDGDLLARRGETSVERLVARGDAILESREWKDAGRAGDPRLFRVTGPLVDYRVDTGEARVEGAGGLLVHDPDPAPGRRADAPVEAGFGVDGTSRFRWKKEMTMTRQAEGRYLVVMDEQVEVVHAGLEVDDTMSLTGDRLEVVIDRGDDERGGVRKARSTDAVDLGGSAEIVRVRGLGAVFIRTPEHDVECAEFDYNVDTGIAMLLAAPGRVVTIRSKSATTPVRAERVQWDLRSGRLRILGGEGGLAR